MPFEYVLVYPVTPDDYPDWNIPSVGDGEQAYLLSKPLSFTTPLAQGHEVNTPSYDLGTVESITHEFDGSVFRAYALMRDAQFHEALANQNESPSDKDARAVLSLFAGFGLFPYETRVTAPFDPSTLERKVAEHERPSVSR